MNKTNNLMNSMDQIWTRIENVHQCVHSNLHRSPMNQRKIRNWRRDKKQQFGHLVVKQGGTRTELVPFVQLLSWIVTKIIAS